jgi:hypothetical protein
MEVKGWRRNNTFRIGEPVQMSRKTEALGFVKPGSSVRLPHAKSIRFWG